MNTEDKLIMAGAGLVVAYFLWQKLSNPEEVSQSDVNKYTQKAAEARNLETWYAPLQQKQAIAETNADGSTTTYFLDDEDYNSMSRWERLLYSWDYPLKKLF